jgi:hypothetical protein
MTENAVQNGSPARTNRAARRTNKPPAPPEPVTLTLTAESVYVPWDDGKTTHNTLKFTVVRDTDDNASDDFFAETGNAGPLFSGNLYPLKPALRAAMIAAGIRTMPKTAHIAVTFTF